MPKPDRRAERIPQILQAALTVFARSGFAEARMEDIAQEAGLSKAAVYLYFPSKDELTGALLQQYFANAFADLTALRDSSGPLRARLGVWVERRIAELEADPAYLGIGYEFFAVAARQEAVREVLRDYYRRYRTELATLIDRAAANGEAMLIQAPELATALVALFEGLTLLWVVEPEGVNLHQVTAQALDKLLGAST